MGRAQGVIFEKILNETWGVFIGILWLRFCLPSGGVDTLTAKHYESGTEEEFKLAYKLWQEDGRPRIMFYRCSRPPSTMIGLDIDQYRRVEEFFKDFDATKGAHPGLYISFDTSEKFVRLVREHLA